MGEPYYKCRGESYSHIADQVANPDLLGIGVMTSFLATTIATFGFILYGARCNLILDKITNSTDLLFFRWLGSKSPPIGRARLGEQRAFFAAIVAISDQQLIIGISVLVAGLSDCSLSVYGVQNLAALAWQISFVHILTVFIICISGRSQSYNKPLKAIRVVGISIFVLLTVFVLLLENAVDISWDKSVLDGPSNSFAAYYLLSTSGPLSVDWFTILNTCFEIFFIQILLSAYLRQVAMYWDSSYWEKFFQGGIFKFICFHTLAKFPYGETLSPGFAHGLYQYVWEHACWTEFQKQNQSAVSYMKTKKLTGKSLLKVAPFLLWGLMTELPTDLQRCFVDEFGQISNLLLFSILKVITCWYQFLVDKETRQEVLAWGPGQIIAVLSLAAPILAWLHAFFEDGELSCDSRAVVVRGITTTKDDSQLATQIDHAPDRLSATAKESAFSRLRHVSSDPISKLNIKLDTMDSCLIDYDLIDRESSCIFSIGEFEDLSEFILLSKISFCWEFIKRGFYVTLNCLMLVGLISEDSCFVIAMFYTAQIFAQWIWDYGWAIHQVVLSLQRVIKQDGRMWKHTRPNGFIPFVYLLAGFGVVQSTESSRASVQVLVQVDDLEQSPNLSFLRFNTATRGTFTPLKKRMRELMAQAHDKQQEIGQQRKELVIAIKRSKEEVAKRVLELDCTVEKLGQAKIAEGILKSIEFGGYRFSHLYCGEEVAKELERGCHEKVKVRFSWDSEETLVGSQRCSHSGVAFKRRVSEVSSDRSSIPNAE
ncbi:hypothetical protein BJ508DRAFT_417153 [Ascobolus immersus RN42]|uniref:Uncharacterized protein n=1 Tax=Ascobolus immersus RN42 TaxID=1160509 RepID=A0A3N4HXU9_ASCIM|nr:hypothetical protein BJ508DRAFT_417153 [Ascobolus immersus RN42]